MNAPADKGSTEREALIGLFTSLLRPLMPLALERGISAREVSDAVRRAYVEALETRMAGQDRKLSDARLALVAGLTRSEVKLFRNPRQIKTTEGRSAEQLDTVAKLLSVWHTHPKFSGAYGLALDLDLEDTTGSPHRTFGELVETACPGADRESLLDELIAIGSVEVVDRTTVRCNSRAAVWRSPDEAPVDQIDRAAKCLEAAAGSFAHNLQHQGSSKDLYFDRMVISDHPISSRDRDEFQSVAQARGENYVVELDTWLTKHTQPDTSPNGKRYGVGVYFFEEGRNEHQSTDVNDARPANSEVGRQGKVQEIDVLAPPNSLKA